VDDDQLQIRASAMAAEATSRIVAELGPRALPTLRDHYLASAEMIVEEVFGENWEVRVDMDVTGAPHIFVGQYRGRS
jgi:hypothetical protein